MPIEFNRSPGYTLGIEEEFAIVDPATGDLVPKVEEIMARLPRDLSPHVSYELFQSVIETKTPVCRSVAEAEGWIRDLRARLFSQAVACGTELAACGTHPFSRYTDQKITDQERYRHVVEVLRWVAERELIFGQHVHVGVPGPEEAILANNRLSEYAPLLLALSSNSPFWQGHKTGYDSARVKVFETFPRAGLPPAFPDYRAFEEYVDLMVEAGAIDDYTFCWWDIRPHPNLGTVELRIFDVQTEPNMAVALIALSRCLVAHVIEQPASRKPYNRELAQENKLRAARYGMDAIFYEGESRASVPAREQARRLVEELRPISRNLGCEEELAEVLEHVEGSTGSRRQQSIYERNGDFMGVISHLVEATRPALAEERS